ncbi:MAG: tetratricopeptide repeat protein, partial [Alphaproteobacteria bacterium]
PAPAAALAALTRSTSPSAVESLMVAFEFRGRRSPEDLAVAIEAARRATTLDPSYMLAWATLAELHQVEATRWYQPPRVALASAREAARRAFALDPTAPATNAVLGSTSALLDLDFAGALAHLDRAIANDPAWAAARVFRSFLLLSLGRVDLAERDARVAVEGNPLATQAREVLCLTLIAQERAGEALDEIRTFAAQAPTIDSVLSTWAVIAAFVGEPDEAIAAGRRANEISPSTTQMHLGLLFGLVADGQAEEARGLLASIRAAEIPAPPALLAPALIQLGDVPAAVALLETARDSRCPHFLVSERDPRLAVLASDPRFDSIWAGLRAARREALERRPL